MPIQRLYVVSDLSADGILPLGHEQAHYLKNVLRLKQGDPVHVFNGRNGEWHATLAGQEKKISLKIGQQLRPQTQQEDVHYLFAPLKHARLDYMAQKATEMGASLLQPVLTQNTQVSRVNLERLHANAIEAAEQCGLLAVPEIGKPVSLQDCLANWGEGRHLIFCDESAPDISPLAALSKLKNKPCAVLIGPEGGFTKEERKTLLDLPFTTAISLGPRILRADTAAVAALAILWLARR